MKTKQIKGKVDILLVDDVLPIGYKSVEDTLANGVSFTMPDGYSDSFYLSEEYDKDVWKFLSTIENLTEEQASEILGILPISYSSIKNNKAAFEHLLKANDADDFNPKTTLIFIKQ